LSLLQADFSEGWVWNNGRASDFAEISFVAVPHPHFWP